MSKRRVGTLLVGFLSALLLLGVAAPEALAHAALLKTTPGDAEILQTGPSEATLTFGESVGIGLGNLKVEDDQGRRVDTGTATRSDNDTVVHIPIRSGLAQGSYVVIWRVVSADSHPVSGAFTFSVGKPSGNLASRVGRGNLTSLNAAPRAPSIALGTTRFLGFSALLVLLGGAIFCLVLWPAGVPRLRGMLLGAALVEMVMAVFGLLLEGPYAAGEGLGKTFDGGLLKAVLKTKYGEATASRIAIAALAALVVIALGKRAGRGVAAVIGVLGLWCALTWSTAGHAGVGSWEPLTYVFDVTHLVFVSAWVGGLVVLTRGLRGRWTADEQAALLPGWSRLASWSVSLLVATGIFASFREVSELDALFTTKYGLLLVGKDVLVGLMLLFALVGRSFVRTHYTRPVAAAATDSAVEVAGPPTDEDVAGLRRSVGIETTLAVGVLIVTSFLVNSIPAKDSFAPPYTGKSTAGPLTVAVDIYPAHKGLNGLHVYTVGKAGLTVDVAEVDGYLERKNGDRITIHPGHKSLGHYEDLNVLLPAKGSYTIDLQIRVDDLNSYETKQTFTVK